MSEGVAGRLKSGKCSPGFESGFSRAHACRKFLNAMLDVVQIHRVHLGRYSNSTQQGDREGAAEMFAEFLEPGQQSEIAGLVAIEQRIDGQLESEPPK